MNKKILMLTITLLAVAMLTTPMVQAVPGAPKNNLKFQTWHYEKTGNFFLNVILGGEHEWIPSFEKVNKLVINWTAKEDTYNITVGTNTYRQGIDFECVDIFAETYFIKPVFNTTFDPYKLYPIDFQTTGLRADYTYNFSAHLGGIEGTLHIREIGNAGAHYTYSLEGTGHLQNVQVKGVYYAESFNMTTGILTIFDDGTVIGWPDIPPA